MNRSVEEISNDPLVIQRVIVGPDLTPERFVEKVKARSLNRSTLAKDIFDIVVREEVANEVDPGVLRFVSTKLWMKANSQVKRDYKGWYTQTIEKMNFRQFPGAQDPCVSSNNPLVQNFLENMNYGNISPPALDDPLRILDHFKYRVRKMNAKIILELNVLQEAKRLRVNDRNVTNEVICIIWKRATTRDIYLWKQVSENAKSHVTVKFPLMRIEANAKHFNGEAGNFETTLK
ncbi:5360_t:CDS:2 [Acaulospora colombiana]|uniref:5360_t:CDS:1 n=1 Tax=Acaulospora colombiana TaxID=27376 RepID=A0ACA9LQ51_9GLOM|nr:5360_t:CDS:2 [Acaulospora colombiana]